MRWLASASRPRHWLRSSRSCFLLLIPTFPTKVRLALLDAAARPAARLDVAAAARLVGADRARLGERRLRVAAGLGLRAGLRGLGRRGEVARAARGLRGGDGPLDLGEPGLDLRADDRAVLDEEPRR